MKKLLYLIAFFTCLTACQRDEITPPEETVPGQQLTDENGGIKGHIRVRFKPEAVEELQIVRTRSGEVTTGISDVDQAGAGIRVTRMERVFPEAGKFEARHRAAGLHLWYDVYFDRNVATRSAVDVYSEIPGIDHVEIVPEIRLAGVTPVPAYMQPILTIQAFVNTVAAKTEKMPFNDPRLIEQWHYHNTGTTLNGAIAGADVNAFKAWEIEKGSKEVIVAVMDGGIQFNHPDLAANMWVNEAEKNGLPGVDDDGNGKIDDVYGYNFVSNKGEVTQHEHGTHCAGTISAVNNNGIGVCGIAGGSGKGDGVRLMSCQMFQTDPATGKDQSGGGPDMYVYAADNGAVISQNSWTSGPGIDFQNSATRAAIDYFIDHAGMDLNGKQTGPMKGGIVIFATANRNSDIEDWPAAYERNLRVSAMGADFKKASYSNYGTWVDITAPGGEQSKGNEYAILSTTINDGYAWLQGTSMACPHASGCAALVLSKFQGEGYTPQDLRDRLLNSVGNIDQYNPKYAGKMGQGYIDVGTALTPPSTVPPVVTDLRLIDSYDTWAIFEWNVVKASDGPLSKYELCWSTASIVEGAGRAVVHKKTFDVKFKKEGDLVRDTIQGLDPNTQYYYTLRGVDRWGTVSEYSPEQEAITVKNNAPKLTAAWSGQVLVDEGTERVLSLSCVDPEGQTIKFRVNPALSWVTMNLQENQLNLSIKPYYGQAGIYNISLIATDQYGAESNVPVAFEVISKNVAPVLLHPILDMKLKVAATDQMLSLTEYFKDPAGGSLTYEVENTASGVAFVQRQGDQLLVAPRSVGVASILVRAVNNAGFSVSCRFSVEVSGSVSGGDDWSASVVGKKLVIRLNPDLQGASVLRLYNVAGRQVIAKDVVIGTSGYELDISSQSAGVYALTIECSNGTKLSKNIVKK